MPESQDNKQSPEQLQDAEKKNLKKLLEAHMSVLEHKLGRAPTMQELTQELAEMPELEQSGETKPTQGSGGMAERMMQQSAELDQSEGAELEEEEPKVLHYKVYYGLKSEKNEGGEESKVPDPGAILFFETPDQRVYDTRTHSWCDERPEVMDHLNSRPMMFDERGHDIMAALLNGVLDEDDYGALEKADMLNEHHRKIWELQKKLYAQMGELEKSEEDETEEFPERDVNDYQGVKEGADVERDPGDSYDLGGEQPAEGTTNVIQEYQQGNTQDYGEQPELPGEDLIRQIVTSALSSPEIDRRLRDVIREEVSKHFSQFLDMVGGMEPQPDDSQDFGEYTEEATP